MLEDDCLPSPAFFRFCTELLERYRGDMRVFAISGDNFVESATPPVPSYWFNRIFHVWGWASWRDRWSAVPLQIDAADAATIARRLRGARLSRAEVAYWTPLFDRVRTATAPGQRIDSWAYPAAYHVLVNQFLCASPARNLVANVGFGPDSTHFRTADADDSRRLDASDLEFPLRHPPAARLHQSLYRRNLRQHFGIRVRSLPWLLEAALAVVTRRHPHSR